MAQPASHPPFTLPKEFTTRAREHRYRVLALFLGIAAAFGIAARLFFVPTFLEAGMISGGLALVILGSLPVSRLHYTISSEFIEMCDMTPDRFQATAAVPLLAGVCIFLILFFERPAVYYLYLGIACAVLLPALRRFFPQKGNVQTQSLPWAEVRRIVAEPKRCALLLATAQQGGSTKQDMMVFCPVAEYQNILGACLSLSGIAEAEQGDVVR